MLTVFQILHTLMGIGFSTKKTTKKCKIWTGLSLISYPWGWGWGEATFFTSV